MSLTRIHDQFARQVTDLKRKGVAKGAEKIIAGSARSMGLEVVG